MITIGKDRSKDRVISEGKLALRLTLLLLLQGEPASRRGKNRGISPIPDPGEEACPVPAKFERFEELICFFSSTASFLRTVFPAMLLDVLLDSDWLSSCLVVLFCFDRSVSDT